MRHRSLPRAGLADDTDEAGEADPGKAHWQHAIVVEKVLESGQASGSPRCTGGRRAAPPEDCGGVWGFAELAEILSDPAHPEHDDRLEWLGLDDAADFDPASFDAQTVTRRLAGIG